MWSDSAGRRHQLDAPDHGSFTIGRVAIEVGGDIDIATAPRFAKFHPGARPPAGGWMDEMSIPNPAAITPRRAPWRSGTGACPITK